MSDPAIAFLQFSEKLNSLRDFPDLETIRTLTDSSKSNLAISLQIAGFIIARLANSNTNSSYKLPMFYLIDSIMKNVGGPYPSLFSKLLMDSYIVIFTNLFGRDVEKLIFLLGTWDERKFIPVELLIEMKKKLTEINERNANYNKNVSLHAGSGHDSFSNINGSAEVINMEVESLLMGNRNANVQSNQRISGNVLNKRTHDEVFQQNQSSVVQGLIGGDHSTLNFNINSHNNNDLGLNFSDLVKNEMIATLNQMYIEMNVTNPLSLDELAVANPNLYAQIEAQAISKTEEFLYQNNSNNRGGMFQQSDNSSYQYNTQQQDSFPSDFVQSNTNQFTDNIRKKQATDYSSRGQFDQNRSFTSSDDNFVSGINQHHSYVDMSSNQQHQQQHGNFSASVGGNQMRNNSNNTRNMNYKNRANRNNNDIINNMYNKHQNASTNDNFSKPLVSNSALDMNSYHSSTVEMGGKPSHFDNKFDNSSKLNINNNNNAVAVMNNNPINAHHSNFSYAIEQSLNVYPTRRKQYAMYNGFICEVPVMVDVSRTRDIMYAIDKKYVDNSNVMNLPNVGFPGMTGYVNEVASNRIVKRLSSLLNRIDQLPQLPQVLFGPLPAPIIEIKDQIKQSQITNKMKTNQEKVLHEKVPFRIEELGRNPEVAVRVLYSGQQYHEDGLRFATLLLLQKHTDEFLERKKLVRKRKENKEREFREYYCNSMQWVSNFNVLVDPNKENHDNYGKGASNNAMYGQNNNKNMNNNDVEEEFIVPADENFTRCPISKEIFESFYDEDEGEFMYRNAVKIIIPENIDNYIYSLGKPLDYTTSNTSTDNNNIGVRYLIVHKILILNKMLTSGKAVTLKSAIEKYEQLNNNENNNDKNNNDNKMLDLLKNCSMDDESDEDVFVILS
eukprot:gene7574-10318_t